MVETLASRLAELAAHPRAVPWVLRFYSGFSSSAPVHSYTIFAPPLGSSAPAVLSRLHNGVLLLNPAAVELDAPVEADRLEPLLSTLRGIHRVGIFLRGEARHPVEGPFDLPSTELPSFSSPGQGVAAGLDIGGTGMKACVMSPEDTHTPLRVDSAPTWPDGEAGIDSLISRARALIQKVAGGQPIGSLGIGLASPMGVGGQVLELSTVMRERVGDTQAFASFSTRVSEGLVDGPVAIFNDLTNLGRYLSAQGARRTVRLQIGTSFGGCWIDANGTVNATEMGRLIADIHPDATPHTYLPIKGAMKSYLSNYGLALYLSERLGQPVDARTSGHLLKELLDRHASAGIAALDRMAAVLEGVVEELHALLPGVTRVECGGSMLLGPAGRGLVERIGRRPTLTFGIARQPAHDGAMAAALAPRVDIGLKAMRRVG